MKTVFAAALALAATLALSACGKDEGKQANQPTAPAADNGVPNPLRVATEGAYPPYNMLDSGGNLVGFEVDMMKEVCRRIQVECRITAQAWDGMIPALQAGRFDAIVAGMSITEERKQAVSFTQGYASTPAYLVSAKSNPLQAEQYGLEKVNLDEVDATEQAAIDKVRAQLKGKTVGVQTATIHANFADKYLADVVDLRRYDTQENLVLDLQTGRVEVGLADAVAWEPFLDRPEGQQYGFFGPGFDGGLFGAGMGVAIAKGQDKLLDALNGAIASMKQDGTLKTMAEQWFGFDTSLK
ncbi:transporter substrate-binding domain-containing protein [Aerophototrophica crusticola]|uniref:Transporter substrate-binding domain-containing protein n=1 Tax=Aerophototrophica crusticola TaxID=1709002 RepID=A0A858R3N9_9PROT|nr:transporter substrate-binding domain-containing protein [Rhodospirillaceae bacterium B3]